MVTCEPVVVPPGHPGTTHRLPSANPAGLGREAGRPDDSGISQLKGELSKLFWIPQLRNEQPSNDPLRRRDSAARGTKTRLGTGTEGWFGFTCRVKAFEEGKP